jgi:hypothetical protein
VDLAQQTPRDRKRVESHHAVLQRADVVGDLTDRGDNRLRRQGEADQMMGKLKQTGEKVKDAFKK